jgi:TrmH family RNA methyltransferase
MSSQNVRFVLVQPQYAGNTGSTARALKNLGFSRLVLVRPAFRPDDPEARKMAVEARDLLAAARVCEALDEALEGTEVTIGTTRRTGKQRKPHWRLDDFAPQLAGLAAAGEIAVVFGREDSGLSDEELDRCTHLVYLPASPDYGSFNLAQAVLLVAWELRRARLPDEADPLEPAADHASREAMYRQMQEALLAIGFLHRDSTTAIMRQFRRLLGRARLTPHDVQLLRGLARQTSWAAKQAGLIDPPDTPTVDDGSS